MPAGLKNDMHQLIPVNIDHEFLRHYFKKYLKISKYQKNVRLFLPMI